MFTTCPKCALNLAITAADLRIGQGYVRCGRCSSVFNALVGLADDGENAIEQPPPAAAPPTDAGKPGEPSELAPAETQMLVEAGLAEGDPGTGTFETIILEGEGIMQTTEVVAEDEVEQQLQAIADRIEAQQNEFDAEDAMAAIPLTDSGEVEVMGVQDEPVNPSAENTDVSFDDGTEERGRLLRALAGFGVGLLALLLAGQLVHHYRARFAGFAPLVALYESLGVPLEPQLDLASYDVRQLGYEADPQAKDIVLIRASVQNVGKVSQPLPLLRVTMQDRFGNLTQRVELAPRDYLLAQSAAKPLAPGSRVDARIQVRVPEQPVDYQLDVCTADRDGRLRCADDRGPFQ